VKKKPLQTVDVPPSAMRSAIMRSVRQKDTLPELQVRRLVHSMGFRFRLHRKDLPGTPDLVFPRHKKVIFVHGCFWHSHYGCKRATVPQTRNDFWTAKFARNRERDEKAVAALSLQGWKSLVIWECEAKNASTLAGLLRGFLRT
jgi:DNA mismatch endonuclease (patch repair protein)